MRFPVLFRKHAAHRFIHLVHPSVSSTRFIHNTRRTVLPHIHRALIETRLRLPVVKAVAPAMVSVCSL
jgi:hypothetical protein